MPAGSSVSAFRLARWRMIKACGPPIVFHVSRVETGWQPRARGN